MDEPRTSIKTELKEAEYPPIVIKVENRLALL